ncbi:MAG: SH3 domain-containing protein [Aggregatilineaceae bacterium]
MYFPWWSLLILVGVVAVVTLGIVLAFSVLMEPQTPGDQAPRVQIITAQPTLSQDFLGAPAQDNSANPALWPTPIRPAVSTATLALPTPIPSPTLPPGDLIIGVLVKVVGVGTSGLNIRSSPGYSGTPRFLAAEGEVFAIVDGPQTIDGLEWWRVEDPDDSQRFGWAARNYLMVIAPSE